MSYQQEIVGDTFYWRALYIYSRVNCSEKTLIHLNCSYNLSHCKRKETQLNYNYNKAELDIIHLSNYRISVTPILSRCSTDFSLSISFFPAVHGWASAFPNNCFGISDGHSS